MEFSDKFFAHIKYEPEVLKEDTVEFECYIVKYWQPEDDSWNFMLFRELYFAQLYADWVRNSLGFHEVIIEEGYAPILCDPCEFIEFRRYLDREYHKEG